jgi:hypothetical protein
LTSLKYLLGEKDANHYLRLVQNGLVKQNLNTDELTKLVSLDLRPLLNSEIGKIIEKAAMGFTHSLYSV